MVTKCMDTVHAIYTISCFVIWLQNVLTGNKLCIAKCVTDSSKAVLLSWIIHVISVLCVLCFHARLFIDALWSPAVKGLTSWLSFVMSNCEFVTSHWFWVKNVCLQYFYVILSM